jgi:hypothetical protein
MKRFWIYTLALTAVLALAWATGGREAQASNKIARKEGLACTVCHDKPGSRLLTDRGKYYEEMHSLNGYDAVISAFSQCTSCHVKQPGSKTLTPNGKRFAGVVHDMPGLRQWLQESHPGLKSEPLPPTSQPPPQ